MHARRPLRRCCRATPLTPSSQHAAPLHSQDIITRTFEFCGTLANGFAAVAVRRATDVVAALAPDATPRQNVETAVKGGLALVALALLKSVLSVRRGCRQRRVADGIDERAAATSMNMQLQPEAGTNS